MRVLHELLCLWHAYPDDREVFDAVARRLDAFASRRDLRRHRDALENSGIAGTDIVYPFGAPTAQWLAARFPARSPSPGTGSTTPRASGVTCSSSPAPPRCPATTRRPSTTCRAWTTRLAGGATDAAFIVRGSAALDADTLVRDAAYNELDLPIRVAPAPGSPRRSGARWARAAVAFRTRRRWTTSGRTCGASCCARRWPCAT